MLFKYANEQIHSFLTHVSGPQAATDVDVNMVTKSNITDTIFEYVAPSGTIQTIVSEIVLSYHVGDPGLGTFQGWGNGPELTNGCVFEIIDTDGITQLLDLFGGQPISSNRDFSSHFTNSDLLSPGIGSILRGVLKFDDSPLTLIPGQILRWTNQDDLVGVGFNADMRCLIRGALGSIHS